MSRSSSGPDYDFGPYDDEYRGFDIRDDESGRGPLILLLALGVLLIFAGVVWNTYRQGVRPAEGGLPVIGADAGQFKRLPDIRTAEAETEPNAGFYDLIDGGAPDTAVRKAAMSNPADLRRDSGALAGAPAEQAQAVPPLPQPDPSETRRVPAPIEFAEGLDVRTPPSEETETVQTAALTPAAPVQAASRPVEAGPLPAPRSVPSRFSAPGTFQVQLLASRSEGAALNAWEGIKTAHPALYDGAKLSLQRADLGARGVFYRLRLGAFETRDGARAFCDDVKATGKDCIVVAKAAG